MDQELQCEIEECLRYDSPVRQPKIRPLTDTLYYNYDFGDNWYVKVTASLGALPSLSQSPICVGDYRDWRNFGLSKNSCRQLEIALS